MRSFLSVILIIPIRIYKLLISPLFPPKCIYYPSCSTYCIEALEKHGPFKGLLFGALRILRCSPLFKGGVDVVEPKTSIKVELKKFNEFLRRRKS